MIGYVALFVALSGTAYAANTVGSSDIIDESILSQDIKNGEVKNPDLGASAVGSGKIADGTVGSADVANDTTDFGLTAQDLEPGSVGTSEVADASLINKDVAANSIEGSNIADTSLTGADIGNDTLTGADIGFGSLTGVDVANSSLTGSDIAPGSLTGSDIADTNSIGGAEIDESDLALPFTAVDDGPDTGECEGVLSNSPEVCAAVDVNTLPPFLRVFIVASGGWSKRLGDPAQSVCRLQVDDQNPPEALLFMGDQTGFGGGHSIPRAQLPFTLNATTDPLSGIHRIQLKCDDESSGDQDTFIGNAHISALVAG